MKKDYIDSKLYETLHFTPNAGSQVQDKVNAAYEKIRSDSQVVKTRIYERKNDISQKRSCRLYMSIAAAALLSLSFIGFCNTAMAGKIPFIGRIFNLVGTQVGYPGDFSEHSIPIHAPESAPESYASDAYASDTYAPDSYAPDTYSQTVNGVTITLSEASYTEMALYYSLELYCEEGFPEGFNHVKNMEGYILPYDCLYMTSSQSFDFAQSSPGEYPDDIFSGTIDEGLPSPYVIEGNFVDANTFLGIIRVDLSIMKRLLKADSFPKEFIYSFTIENFWGELIEVEYVEASDHDTGETIAIPEPLRKHYEGPWSFTVPVSLDQASTQVKDIMETNDDGIGIASVTKTRYEISAEIILPDNAKPEDYFISITDADGKILESQGTYAEIYSVYGRNTDTVYVYVVDYLTYMDECKAENAYRLPEKALFQTKIDW